MSATSPGAVSVQQVLSVLEAYYDEAPRASAGVEAVGPFTLFLRTDPAGFHYYARPRLGLTTPVTAADVDAVRRRQRELGVPENLEWVHETTPSLLAAARASGLTVTECPLLVLPQEATVGVVENPVDVQVRVLGPDDDLDPVVGAVHAGFDGTDEVTPRPSARRASMIRDGLLAMVGAYDGRGQVLGGGSHGPRGTTTELTGIAVLPRARRRGVGAAVTAALAEDARRRGVRTVFLSAQDNAVARVYERTGFVRVGTACVAEPGA
jgi:ribosomal protein S18 acetylase RimI-like enzyme